MKKEITSLEMPSDVRHQFCSKGITSVEFENKLYTRIDKLTFGSIWSSFFVEEIPKKEINLSKAQRNTFSKMRSQYAYKTMNGSNVVMRSAIQDEHSTLMTYDKHPDIEIDINGKII